MVLSLQGCMAVGKTTAMKYIEKNAPYINISFEDNTDVTDEIRRRGLDKNRFEDYVEIQRLWLKREIIRYNKAKDSICSLMDFGAEEIYFYTLNYPKSIGLDWNIEDALKDELDGVNKCMPARILFLAASDETLRRRKDNDTTRTRRFFEHYVNHLLPLKREWFFGRNGVDVLNVDFLSPDEVGQRVKKWCDICIAEHR